MWFRNVMEYGGTGYCLTYCYWCAVEANTTTKELNRNLAHYHGINSVCNFFTADYWNVSKQWKWKQFDTPDQQDMVSNALYNPTHIMIAALNQQQTIFA